MKKVSFFKIAFLILFMTACQSQPQADVTTVPDVEDFPLPTDYHIDDYGYAYATPEKIINLIEQDPCFIRNKCEISMMILGYVENIPTYICDINFPLNCTDPQPIKCLARSETIQDSILSTPPTAHQFYRNSYPQMALNSNVKFIDKPAQRLDLKTLPITRNSDLDTDSVKRVHFTYVLISLYEPYLVVRNVSVKKAIKNYIEYHHDAQTIWINPLQK